MNNINRIELKKSAKELNDLGSRLYWVRNKLRLKSIEVCKATSIPPSSYCDREAGLRTSFYEELLVLAMFFNSKWQIKYHKFNSYPTFNGKEVREISFMWLMFGYDSNMKEYEILIENIKENFKQRELDLMKRNEELRNQINMFETILAE